MALTGVQKILKGSRKSIPQSDHQEGQLSKSAVDSLLPISSKSQ